MHPGFDSLCKARGEVVLLVLRELVRSEEGKLAHALPSEGGLPWLTCTAVLRSLLSCCHVQLAITVNKHEMHMIKYSL